MKLISRKKNKIKSLKFKKGFTVAELMVSLSIGLLILSAALYLMIQAFNGADAMIRDYYLTLYGRILREKLVRSVDGHNGLRVAMWESFWIQYLPGNDPAKPDHVAKISYEYLDMASDYEPVDANVRTVFITRHKDELTETFKKEKNLSKNDKFVSIFSDPVDVTAMEHELVPRNDITRRPRYLRSNFKFEFNIGGKNYETPYFYTIQTTIVNDEP